MADRKGGSQDERVLELLREKRSMEEEIAKKTEEVKQLDAQFQAKKRKAEEDQRQGRAESKRLAEQLTGEQTQVKRLENQLKKLREDLRLQEQAVDTATREKDAVEEDFKAAQMSAQLAVDKRKGELEAEKLEKHKEAAMMKTARKEEMEQTAERYREELRLLEERKTRQMELLKGLQTAMEGWKLLLEQKKREHKSKEEELMKLKAQLVTVQEHVQTLENAHSALLKERDIEGNALKADTEHQKELTMQVEAALASCTSLQASISTLTKEGEKLEAQCRVLFGKLERGNEELRRLQRETEVFLDGLERVSEEYKQEDHRVAFLLKREDTKVKTTLSQLDTAKKDLQDSHRLQRDLLRTQKDSLKRLQTVTPKSDFNLDTRYSQPKPVPKPLPIDKTSTLQQQLSSKQSASEHLKSQITGLISKIDQQRKRISKSSNLHGVTKGAARQTRQLLVIAGVALGVLMELWLQ